ncbi:MAG: hypothetical protein ACI8QD_002826 [Cyclobacteriaceae bacterium]|jgi:hypothetical protein
MKIGVIKVRAFFNMVAYDNDGKKIFSIIEYGTSKNSVPSVLGVPVLKLEKIMPMCQSASDKLMADLQKDLGKIVKKTAKKM